VTPFAPDSLEQALDARLDAVQEQWFAAARAKVVSLPDTIATVFPAVGRGVGRDWLAPVDATGIPELDSTATTVHTWTLDDAARTLLLTALGDDAEAQLQPLYRHGDPAERRGVLRALPFLPITEAAGLALVDDALRTNDVGLIAAAMGPFAGTHLSDDAYAQAVLKCVFVGVPLTGVAGTPERTTPELAAMLGRYIHERIAAGRVVPEDVWPLIDRYPPSAELAAIEAELSHPHDDRRQAAEVALAARARLTPPTES
jgi:hypothetical protein